MNTEADVCPGCPDCEGEDHHWSHYLEMDADNPDHPAAQAGVEFWQRCKHCDAWREPGAGGDDDTTGDDDGRAGRSLLDLARCELSITEVRLTGFYKISCGRLRSRKTIEISFPTPEATSTVTLKEVLSKSNPPGTMLADAALRALEEGKAKFRLIGAAAGVEDDAG